LALGDQVAEVAALLALMELQTQVAAAWEAMAALLPLGQAVPAS
jgi:hypothetical protein